MKIRLEIPKTRELPSQGRNADSNSAGGTTAFEHVEISVLLPWLGKVLPVPGAFYRAWMDPDKADAEFVHFVGWSRSNDRLVFEDGNGDLHGIHPDEIEVV